MNTNATVSKKEIKFLTARFVINPLKEKALLSEIANHLGCFTSAARKGRGVADS